MVMPLRVTAALGILFAPFVMAQDVPTKEEAFREVMENKAQALSVEELDDLDIRELIRSVLVVQLSQALDLDHDKTVWLAERLRAHRTQFLGSKMERSGGREDLRGMIDDGADGDEIREALYDLLAFEREIAESTCTLVEASQNDLSVDQAARYYLFLGDFENDMRRLVRMAQRMSDPEWVERRKRREQERAQRGQPAFGDGEEPMSEGELIRSMLEHEARELDVEDVEESNVRELINMVMTVRLAKRLDLSDEQTLLFARHVGTYKDELLALKGKRARTTRHLRGILDGDAPEEAVTERLEKLLNLEHEIAELTGKLVKEAEKEFDVGQTAKLYLFLGDFENDMRRLIRRAQRLRERYEEQRTEQESSAP